MLYSHIRQSDRVNNIHSVRFNFQPIADKRLGFLCYLSKLNDYHKNTFYLSENQLDF